jgi:hypothetical protein
MIREARTSDFNRMEPNEFCEMDNYSCFIDDASFGKYAQIDDETGHVVCIVIFRPYWGNNFNTALMMSKHFEIGHAKELKLFIKDAMMIFHADRIQTDSQDCDLLNRWHKFLGFVEEGIKKNYLYGKDYKMWGIVNGH